MLIAIITSLTGFGFCSVLAATMFVIWKSYHIWEKSSTNYSVSLATNLHEICKTKKYIQTSSTVLTVAASHIIKGKISKNRSKTIFVPSHKLDFWTF